LKIKSELLGRQLFLHLKYRPTINRFEALVIAQTQEALAGKAEKWRTSESLFASFKALVAVRD